MVYCDYYFDVLSQWCLIADYAFSKLEASFDANMQTRRILVPMDDANLPSRDEQARVYRRSLGITGVKTTPWISAETKPSTREANAAALAASLLGANLAIVCRRIAEAALLGGVNMGDPGVATAFVSREFGIDAATLRDTIAGSNVQTIIRDNLREFAACGSTVRPTFDMKNDIDDRIMLGGQYDFGVLAMAAQSLLSDAAAYHRFAEMDAQT